jgi:hypothetical protein
MKKSFLCLAVVLLAAGFAMAQGGDIGHRQMGKSKSAVETGY